MIHMKKLLLILAVLALALSLAACSEAPEQPGEAEILFAQAMEYWEAEQYREAAVLLEALLGIDPDHATARYFLADAQLQLARLEADPEAAQVLLSKAEQAIAGLEVPEELRGDLAALSGQIQQLRTEITVPETTEAPTEAPTEETIDLGQPQEETVPQETKTTTYVPQTGTTGHNPQVAPQPDDGQVDLGQPEPDTPATDTPVIDPGEPDIIPVPTDPASGGDGPGHNDQVTPDTGETPPSGGNDQVDLGSPDTGGSGGNDQVDLGSPDTGSGNSGNSGHSDQVLPDTGDDMVDLGSPT